MALSVTSLNANTKYELQNRVRGYMDVSANMKEGRRNHQHCYKSCIITCSSKDECYEAFKMVLKYQ